MKLTAIEQLGDIQLVSFISWILKTEMNISCDVECLGNLLIVDIQKARDFIEQYYNEFPSEFVDVFSRFTIDYISLCENEALKD